MSNPLDKPLPEDAEIQASLPLKTGQHELFAEAMRLVGTKHSKSALVEMVNWLLVRVAASEERAQRAERLLNEERELTGLQSRTLRVQANRIDALMPLADWARQNSTFAAPGSE